MNKEQQQENDKAYELCHKLQDVFDDYIVEENGSIRICLGAANMLLETLLINAPTKQDALNTLESCKETIANLINSTPNVFFEVRNQNPNLN